LALRAKIEHNRYTAPFFDAPRFVRDLEAVYEGMWNDYLARKVPG
jgi:predicted O-linked N-acetylglucosamine transferase (SPINDLY family)